MQLILIQNHNFRPFNFLLKIKT